MKKKFVWTAIASCVLAFLFTACDLFPPEVDSASALDSAPEGGYPATLVGTRWEWTSGFGARTLEFDTENHLIFHNDHGDGNPQHLNDAYTYNSSNGKGRITGEYSAGMFQITNNNQTMHFVNFKNYGHGADFTRILP